jgi:16S rRNA processing protein RimM
MEPDLVRIGIVRRPHGLRGALEVEPLTDNIQRFVNGLTVYARGAASTIESISSGRGSLIVHLDGVCNVAAAEKLRGAYLEVPAAGVEPLPPGRYYHWQLVGMRVFDPNGRELGVLRDVLTYPANDVFVVQEAEREVLVPALASVVIEVDLERGRVTVDMPEEMEVQ